MFFFILYVNEHGPIGYYKKTGHEPRLSLYTFPPRPAQTSPSVILLYQMTQGFFTS